MTKQRQLWPIIRRVWITAGPGVTAVFVAWSLIAYRSSATAKQAAQTDSSVVVSPAEGVWRFEPRAAQLRHLMIAALHV